MRSAIQHLRFASRPPYDRLAAESQTVRRAIAYEKSGRWFTAEEPFLRAKEHTDAGSSAFRHPRSELIAPLPQEVEPAFNNRKLHMRLPWVAPFYPLGDLVRSRCFYIDWYDGRRLCRVPRRWPWDSWCGRRW